MLGDTIGELRWWWGLADIGFVGGSFGDRGGQNMIEPAAFGVAVAVGPNTWNFRDIVELLRKADGIEILKEPGQLYDWGDRMLRNPELAKQMGQRASMLVGQHRGATQLTVERLMRLMDRVCKSAKAA
jgi:3-deoxy-D-manno-octulosonic-acid transferase